MLDKYRAKSYVIHRESNLKFPYSSMLTEDSIYEEHVNYFQEF